MRKGIMLRFGASLGACLLVALLGSLVTTPEVPNWYATLNKPWFMPPDYLFAPVWTALYLMMGVSGFLVWNRVALARQEQRAETDEPEPDRPGGPLVAGTAAMVLFGIQLGLNLLWSILFFGLHLPFLAFMDILLLVAAIVGAMLAFQHISRAAALLLAPYLAWVAFAGVLNYEMWVRN